MRSRAGLMGAPTKNPANEFLSLGFCLTDFEKIVYLIDINSFNFINFIRNFMKNIL